LSTCTAKPFGKRKVRDELLDPLRKIASLFQYRHLDKGSLVLAGPSRERE
jgi:hypothetical protein